VKPSLAVLSLFILIGGVVFVVYASAELRVIDLGDSNPLRDLVVTLTEDVYLSMASVCIMIAGVYLARQWLRGYGR